MPLRIFLKIAFLVNVAASVLIAQMTHYPFWIKVIIAYVAFEAIGIIVLGIVSIISWMCRRAFFWMVDITPAEGRNAAEARAVVLGGKVISLGLKLERDIGHWNWEDTHELVALATRRARWFCGAAERVSKRIAILQEYYEETGRHPGDLSPKETKQLVGHLEFDWFEQIVTAPWFFNSALGFVLIVCGIIAANHH